MQNEAKCHDVKLSVRGLEPQMSFRDSEKLVLRFKMKKGVEREFLRDIL